MRSCSLCVLASLLSLGMVIGACSDKPVQGETGDPVKAPSDGTLKPVVAPKPAAPDFATAVAMESRYNKDSGKLEVVLHIKPGFHAYAAGEEVGKPVELAVADKNGWKMEGAPTIPAGTKKDLGALGTSMILEGDVPLSAVVKGGKGLLEGAVTAQVCTDSACDRPKQHPFAIPVI